jgi:hypothetical protein
MIKKSLCSLGIAAIISLSVVFPASAVTCPTCGLSTFVSSPRCSGRSALPALNQPCPYAGQTVGGYYHPYSCQINRYYNLTEYTCDYDGIFVSGTHLENYYHTGGGPSSNPSCPY